MCTVGRPSIAIHLSDSEQSELKKLKVLDDHFALFNLAYDMNSAQTGAETAQVLADILSLASGKGKIPVVGSVIGGYADLVEGMVDNLETIEAHTQGVNYNIFSTTRCDSMNTMTATKFGADEFMAGLADSLNERMLRRKRGTPKGRMRQ